MKSCRQCGILKDTKSFRERKCKDSENRYVMGTCKKCEADYRHNRRSHVKKTLQDIKLKNGCADCGYKDSPYALDFDHLPENDKLFNISEARFSKSLSALLKEVEKCEVVCANCHRIRTAERLTEVGV